MVPPPVIPPSWLHAAIARVEADFRRSTDTHLIALPLPEFARHDSQLCVADPVGSVFGEYHRTGNAGLTSVGSCIEGIGRPCVEASFIRTVIDRMIELPDANSLAAMQALSRLLGRKVCSSTGTHFVGCLKLGHEMLARGEQGSILSLLCDSGERYLPTCYDGDWVQSRVGDCAASSQLLTQLMHPTPAN